MHRRLVIAPLVLKSRVTTHGLSLTFEACDLSKFTAQRVSDSVFMSFADVIPFMGLLCSSHTSIAPRKSPCSGLLRAMRASNTPNKRPTKDC